MRGHVRATASLLALTATSLLTPACGGGESPSVARLGSGPTPTTVESGAAVTGNPPTQQLQALSIYAACLRKHGLPHFPDPPYVSGELSRLGVTKAQLASVQKSCHVDALAAGVVPSQAAIEQNLNEMLATARCMRANGVPQFPDPNANAQSPAHAGPSLDTATPQYVAAAKKCGAPLGEPHGG